MSAAMRALAAHLRADIALMLQYRAEILLWSLWGIINPAVLYAMWSTAAAGSDDGAIAGLDRGGFAAYYVGIMVVSHVCGAWDVYQMGHLVRSGQLSPMLLRPVLPLWKSLSENLSYKIVTLVFVLPMWVIFAWIVKPDFKTEPWQIGWGIAALALGAVLNYMLCYTVSLVAFWATKLDAMGEVYFGLCMFLGGKFAPLEALPGPVLWCAKHLPFRWMYAFPTELLIGNVSRPADAAAGLAVQAVWVVGVVCVFRLLWTVAVRRYTAVSG